MPYRRIPIPRFLVGVLCLLLTAAPAWAYELEDLFGRWIPVAAVDVETGGNLTIRPDGLSWENGGKSAGTFRVLGPNRFLFIRDDAGNNPYICTYRLFYFKEPMPYERFDALIVEKRYTDFDGEDNLKHWCSTSHYFQPSPEWFEF